MDKQKKNVIRQCILIAFLTVWLMCAVIELFSQRSFYVWLHIFPSFIRCAINRVSDTDGMKAVISALGAVCFALTYINTVQTRRVKGVLLEDVVRFYYPYYGYIFILHGCFAALGQYSCTVKIRVSGIFCLVGMLVCLVYAVQMAYGICFSPRRCNRLVSQYIQIRAESSSDQSSSQLVYQVAQYAAQRFEELGGNMENDDILRWLAALVPVDSDFRAIQSNMFPDTFEYLFKSENNSSGPVYSKYIFFSLPGYAERGRIFQMSVQQFSVMWDCLLSSVDSERQQTALACQMLRQAACEMTVLGCGLVRYLYTSRIERLDRDRKKWDACAMFLSSIVKQAEPLEDRNGTRRKILSCCMDMSVIFLCLTLAGQTGAQEYVIDSDFPTLTLDLLRKCGHWGYRAPSLDDSLDQYLCCAYMILQSLDEPTYKTPSRMDMYRQLPVLTRVLQQMLTL